MSGADMRSAAAQFRRLGWSPIPVKHRSKQTSLTRLAPYLERRATKEELSSWSWPGVGIVTGPLSGLIVIDADGEEGEAQLKRRGHPATPMVRTGGGGLQVYCKHPGGDVRTGIRVAPHLDIKAAGGYVVAPPSVHPNGQRYEWLLSPEEVEVADPPSWVLELVGKPQRNGRAPKVGERLSPGQRNQVLTSMAGTMRRRGMSEAEILAALEVANRERCEPPLEDEEVRKIAASVARYEPEPIVNFSINGRPAGSPASPQSSFNLTDLGNSERFVADHGENIRYCWPWARWLVYDGRRWKVDDAGEIHRLAKETVRQMYEEAAAAADEDSRKALAKHAMKSEAENRIQSMISLARSEVPVQPEDLDADGWLLNCLNGTIDLRTGELHEYRREDLITKLAPVEYDPDAKAPTWAAVLERVLPSEAVRSFFKKLCGRAFTGDVSEHILPVLYGTGANGKSTILNALLEAAGDYGMQAAPDLLIAKRGSHPTEVADLFGMRFVASVEVEDGRRLAESLVKLLTGGENVRARKMRQDFWEFPPTHKVFMAVNHKPEIRGTDNAVWRRIRLIPFTETIPPAERDTKLPDKLRGELAGILAWAVEGCLEWQREGLDAPDVVRRATGEYRSEMDVIGAFLKDCCRADPDARCSAQLLYNAYKNWCESGSERVLTRRKFDAALTERGTFDMRRSGKNGAREWHGLKLLTEPNPPFAGKLTDHSANDYNQLESASRNVNSTNTVSPSVASVNNPDPEDEWGAEY